MSCFHGCYMEGLVDSAQSWTGRGHRHHLCMWWSPLEGSRRPNVCESRKHLMQVAVFLQVDPTHLRACATALFDVTIACLYLVQHAERRFRHGPNRRFPRLLPKPSRHVAGADEERRFPRVWPHRSKAHGSTQEGYVLAHVVLNRRPVAFGREAKLGKAILDSSVERKVIQVTACSELQKSLCAMGRPIRSDDNVNDAHRGIQPHSHRWRPTVVHLRRHQSGRLLLQDVMLRQYRCRRPLLTGHVLHPLTRAFSACEDKEAASWIAFWHNCSHRPCGPVDWYGKQ
mmetsp:Transcript_45889/g.106680  ORF Transcript_45889/g.106680 Transcript_45889/m.106680 type:complete len:285 (-) Transcript_45889:1115-1969(-)